MLFSFSDGGGEILAKESSEPEEGKCTWKVRGEYWAGSNLPGAIAASGSVTRLGNAIAGPSRARIEKKRAEWGVDW